MLMNTLLLLETREGRRLVQTDFYLSLSLLLCFFLFWFLVDLKRIKFTPVKSLVRLHSLLHVIE